MDNCYWALPKWRSPSVPSLLRLIHPPVAVNSGTCRFLDLPLELRFMIYAEVINSDATLQPGFCQTHYKTLGVSLTGRSWYVDHGALPRVNRQIRQEFHDFHAYHLAPEIRVDIRHADFSPLLQFAPCTHFPHIPLLDTTPSRWKKYAEKRTRLKVVLHYDPKTSREAQQWGMQRARVASHSFFSPTCEFDISYEVVTHTPTFLQYIIQQSESMGNGLRVIVCQGPCIDTPLEFFTRLSTLGRLRQPGFWSNIIAQEAIPEVVEMYALIEMTMRGSRAGVGGFEGGVRIYDFR